MAEIRRALIFASAGRYASRAVNLLMTVVLARMMAPAEFGISVLGASAFLILEAVREISSINYLVQQKELTPDKINTVFTISFVVTAVLTLLVLLLAHPMAALYGEPRLANYLYISCIGFVLGPLMQPIYALWSRDLAFRTIAAMDVLAATVNAVASIALVSYGFSYLGLAWGSTMSAVTGVAVAAFLARRRLATIRFSLKEWRSVLAFGLYGSATAIIYRVSDATAFLVLGKLLSAHAIGLLQRAITLATFTDTVLLAGLGSVTLPAFSKKARDGADLKQTYLKAISYITAVQWPALAFISAMAYPLTLLLLGPEWVEVAPVAQVIALALMFNFAATLNFPVLVALGAIGKTWPVALAQVAFTLTVVMFAAGHGLYAVALSGLVTTPLSWALWTWLVRRHMPFSLGELGSAVRNSLIVLLFSAAGPVGMMLYRGGAPSLIDAMLAAAMAAGGWLLAIWLTRHPVRGELAKAGRLIGRRPKQETDV